MCGGVCGGALLCCCSAELDRFAFSFQQSTSAPVHSANQGCTSAAREDGLQGQAGASRVQVCFQHWHPCWGGGGAREGTNPHGRKNTHTLSFTVSPVSLRLRLASRGAHWRYQQSSSDEVLVEVSTHPTHTPAALSAAVCFLHSAYPMRSVDTLFTGDLPHPACAAGVSRAHAGVSGGEAWQGERGVGVPIPAGRGLAARAAVRLVQLREMGGSG